MKNSCDSYLGSNYTDLLLSSGADGTIRVWDVAREQKTQVMLIQDRQKREIVKARAIGSHMILSATCNSIQLYDIRKPCIILKETIFEHTPFPEDDENELNDIDLVELENGRVKVVACFDSGVLTVSEIDTNTLEINQTHLLQHKHTNICLKCSFSSTDDSVVYSLGFDFKVILWNLKDVANKSQSRNISEQLNTIVGDKAL